MTTSTSDQTPKPETPKQKKIITVNQTPKPEDTTPDAQTPNPETVGPIPAPGMPKQYRAIGLLKGKYVPGKEIERGHLITSDGTSIYAVVLGKLLGLLKSRIDLEKEHLWVVYPRTKRNRAEQNPDESGFPVDTAQEAASPTQKPELPPQLSKEPTGEDEPNEESSAEPQDLLEEPASDEGPGLHVQMAGIWSPETLHPDQPAPAIDHKPDYFSIRGEVVYQDAESGWVIVKIIQFSRQKTDEKLAPYFNLKLSGFLPEKALKNFWSLDVEREGSNLVIQDGQRIAYLGKKKPPKKGLPEKGKPKRGGSAQQPPRATASPKELPKLKKKQPAQ